MLFLLVLNFHVGKIFHFLAIGNYKGRAIRKRPSIQAFANSLSAPKPVKRGDHVLALAKVSHSVQALQQAETFRAADSLKTE